MNFLADVISRTLLCFLDHRGVLYGCHWPDFMSLSENMDNQGIRLHFFHGDSFFYTDGRINRKKVHKNRKKREDLFSEDVYNGFI